MLELKEVVYSYKYKEQVIELRDPSMEEQINHEEQMKKAVETNSSREICDCIVDALVTIGMKRELKDELSFKNMTKIYENVFKQQKKS